MLKMIENQWILQKQLKSGTGQWQILLFVSTISLWSHYSLSDSQELLKKTLSEIARVDLVKEI